MKYEIAIKTEVGGIKWHYETFREAYTQARSWIRNNPEHKLIIGEIHVEGTQVWYFFNEHGMSRINVCKVENLIGIRPIKPLDQFLAQRKGA